MPRSLLAVIHKRSVTDKVLVLDESMRRGQWLITGTVSKLFPCDGGIVWRVSVRIHKY